MVAVKLAVRNLIGAGLRTWLNVIVLSFSYVVIIWYSGLLEGWNRQARRDIIDWEIGGGQYWNQRYDPYDPFTIRESHGKIPEQLRDSIERGELTPILISQATIYPEGRIKSVVLKGIDPSQEILKIPSKKLDVEIEEIPAMIGTRMAKNNRLNIGDYVTVRWRDVSGVFDAQEMKIVAIFKTNVQTVDNGQIWIPLDRLYEMMQVSDEATILVTGRNKNFTDNVPGWSFKNHDFLLSEVDQIIKTKSFGGSIFYIILLLLAMLAIFDTQVLSIFRRQREIGTDIAMGMTRGQVIRLFTVEGAMHGVLAALFAAVYGIPLLSLQATHGFSMPASTDNYGLAIAERIFPVYSFGLVAGTVLIVMTTVTIVSYLPTRKIAKMNPTDSIRGRIQ